MKNINNAYETIAAVFLYVVDRAIGTHNEYREEQQCRRNNVHFYDNHLIYRWTFAGEDKFHASITSHL